MEKVFSRVIITDEQQQFLVISQRNDEWNFPGGKKEANETAQDCAVREVLEEVGLEIIQLTEIYQKTLVFHDVSWEGHFYFAEQVKGVPSNKEPDKIKAMKFVNSLNHQDFSESLKELIDLINALTLLHKKATKWQ